MQNEGRSQQFIKEEGQKDQYQHLPDQSEAINKDATTNQREHVDV